MSRAPSRRQIGHLALLSLGAFALRPRGARAAPAASLEPLFTAQLQADTLRVAMSVRNTGAAPVDLRVIVGGPASVRIKASLEGGGDPQPLGMPRSPQSSQGVTRAGPRYAYMPLAAGAEADLGAVAIALPSSLAVGADARFTLEAWVSTAEGDVALKTEGVVAAPADT